MAFLVPYCAPGAKLGIRLQQLHYWQKFAITTRGSRVIHEYDDGGEWVQIRKQHMYGFRGR